MTIVLDATVWIDLHVAGLHEKVLVLGSKICSVDVLVREELLIPDGAKLEGLGLQVCELDGAGVAQAAQWAAEAPELSTHDCFSLELARRNGWRLATGDGPLRKKAAAEGVELCDTLDVLDLLADADMLDMADLRQFKRRLYQGRRKYDSRKAKALEKRLRRKQ